MAAPTGRAQARRQAERARRRRIATAFAVTAGTVLLLVVPGQAADARGGHRSSTTSSSPWSWWEPILDFLRHHHRHEHPTPTPPTSPTPTATVTASPTVSPTAVPSVDPTNVPTTGPTATTRPVPTATPTRTPTSAPTSPTTTPTTPPVTPTGFPGAANTGVRAGVALTHRSGNVTVTQDGATVSGLDIDGALIIEADRVTVKDVRVRCAGVSDFCVVMGGADDVLSDAEVGGGGNGTTYGSAIGAWTGGAGSATGTRIIRTDFHHTSDGLRVDGGTTVQDSWIHQLSYQSGAHSDGVQVTSSSDMVFRHNTFVGGTNCNLFLQPSGDRPIADVVVDGNSFAGEARNGQVTSYGLCVDPKVRNVSVTGNRFASGGWQVAPASQDFPWAVWRANTLSGGASLSTP